MNPAGGTIYNRYTEGMGTRDDEDVWASYSQQERLTRADPRKDALKREIESKQGTKLTDNEAQQLKELKTKVNLKELKTKVASKDKNAQKSKAFHTETIKEKEEGAVDTAKTKPTPEKLIRKEEVKREEQAQAGQEYQQQVG